MQGVLLLRTYSSVDSWGEYPPWANDGETETQSLHSGERCSGELPGLFDVSPEFEGEFVNSQIRKV